jgi:hypothetical protein
LVYSISHTYILNFYWTPDSIVYEGSYLLIGGHDPASNYAILRFSIGIQPQLIAQIEYAQNRGMIYSMLAYDSTTFAATGYDTTGTT